MSVIGVYGGFIDKFPMGAVVNRSLTIEAGQCHVHRYMRPLMERILAGDHDPSFVITHHLPLADAAKGYQMFGDKVDECEKGGAAGGATRSRGEFRRGTMRRFGAKLGG